MTVLAATASEAPWWGIPAFTLGAAVLGGVAGQGLGVVNDWRKSRRDRTSSDQATRREAFLTFLTEGNSAANNYGDTTHLMAFSNAFSLMQVLFTGPFEEAARRYYASVLDVVQFGKPSETPEFDELVNKVVTAENELFEIARDAHQDLGLPAAVHGTAGRRKASSDGDDSSAHSTPDHAPR